MRKLLLIAFTLLGVIGNAQSGAKEYAGLLLEFEQNISSKDFAKAWKKDKKDWESKCSSASTEKDVAALTAQLANKVYEVKMVKMKVVATGGLADQCQNLLQLHKNAGAYLDGWNAGKQTTWKGKLEGILEFERKKAEKEADLARVKKVGDMMQGFEATFKAIFEDSKKGSFANTVDGSKKEQGGKTVIEVKQKFAAGSNQIITVDGDNIYQFEVMFDTEGDEVLSAQLLAKMLSIIESNVPEGYKKKIMYGGDFVKAQKYNFEFESEKFADTAKKPSATIGSLKGGKGVQLIISEPVFK